MVNTIDFSYEMVQCKRKEKGGNQIIIFVFSTKFGFAKSHGHSFSASFSSLSHKIRVIFKHMNKVRYTLLMLRTSQKIEVYLKNFKDTLAANLWRNICTREISIQFVCGFFCHNFRLVPLSLSLSFWVWEIQKYTKRRMSIYWYIRHNSNSLRRSDLFEFAIVSNTKLVSN